MGVRALMADQSDNGHPPGRPAGEPAPERLHAFKYRADERAPYYCRLCQRRYASVMLAYRDPCRGVVA